MARHQQPGRASTVRPPPRRADGPMVESSGEITQLVQRWSDGDEDAFRRLMALVYDDLRRIARHHIQVGQPDGTVDTTTLVHEAYLKLAGATEGTWRCRAQFFAFCSKVMRNILVDFARMRQADKRGGKDIRIPLTDDSAAVHAQAVEVLVVEDLLQKLTERHERMARVLECRFFGGMSVPETAEALSTSTRTVEREWARARAYLYRELVAGGGAGSRLDQASGLPSQSAET